MNKKGLKHIENCNDRKEVLLNVESIIEQIGKDKVTETNPFFYTRVMQRLENKQTKPFYNKQFIVRLGNVSSLIVTGMFLGLLFFKQFGKPNVELNKDDRREMIIENIMDEHFLISESKSISVFDSQSELPNN